MSSASPHPAQSSGPPEGADLGQLFAPDYALMALYVPLMLVSLATNALLIIVAVKCNFLKSATNIFLVNLAAADLLVACLCMPIQLSKAYSLFWHFGDTVCKFVNYIQGVAVAASVFTLAAMAAERLLSVAPRPRVPARARAAAAVAAIWVLAALIFSPLIAVACVTKETIPMLTRRIHENLTLETTDVHFCIEDWPSAHSKKHFGIISFTLVYAIPGSITVLCYARVGRKLCAAQPPCDAGAGSFSMQQSTRLMKERKRIAWILMSLAGIFAACWLPYNILQLLLDINAVDVNTVSKFLPYALFAGHANSSINPIIYCLMTRNFQRSMNKLLCGKPSLCQARFTWKCTKKQPGSSSEHDLHHEQHKRCYLQMTSLRYRHCISYPAPAAGSHLARAARRAPRRPLSAEMLQRHHRLSCR